MNWEERGRTRWEQFILLQFKKISDSSLEINNLMEQVKEKIDKCTSEYDFDEFKCYFKDLESSIHMPTWNKYPETNPDSLSTYVEFYAVCERDDGSYIWRNAFWRKDNGFYYMLEGEANKLEGELYWIPLTFPSPY